MDPLGDVDTEVGSDVQITAPENVNDTEKVEEMIAKQKLPITLDEIKPRRKLGRWKRKKARPYGNIFNRLQYKGVD